MNEALLSIFAIEWTVRETNAATKTKIVWIIGPWRPISIYTYRYWVSLYSYESEPLFIHSFRLNFTWFSAESNPEFNEREWEILYEITNDYDSYSLCECVMKLVIIHLQVTVCVHEPASIRYDDKCTKDLELKTVFMQK